MLGDKPEFPANRMNFSKESNVTRIFSLIVLLAFAVPGFSQIQRGVAYAGIEEVNRQRAARGLYPYIEDQALTQAAAGCAMTRATYRISGHTRNDFAYLPLVVDANGRQHRARASCSGCAAWPMNMGFGACELYSRTLRYAGCAWVLGADNKRYCHCLYR